MYKSPRFYPETLDLQSCPKEPIRLDLILYPYFTDLSKTRETVSHLRQNKVSNEGRKNELKTTSVVEEGVSKVLIQRVILVNFSFRIFVCLFVPSGDESH